MRVPRGSRPIRFPPAKPLRNRSSGTRRIVPAGSWTLGGRRVLSPSRPTTTKPAEQQGVREALYRTRTDDPSLPSGGSRWQWFGASSSRFRVFSRPNVCHRLCPLCSIPVPSQLAQNARFRAWTDNKPVRPSYGREPSRAVRLGDRGALRPWSISNDACNSLSRKVERCSATRADASSNLHRDVRVEQLRGVEAPLDHVQLACRVRKSIRSSSASELSHGPRVGLLRPGEGRLLLGGVVAVPVVSACACGGVAALALA
jgi:hypothetical protein